MLPSLQYAISSLESANVCRLPSTGYDLGCRCLSHLCGRHQLSWRGYRYGFHGVEAGFAQFFGCGRTHARQVFQ
jgi:hypothetical protein